MPLLPQRKFIRIAAGAAYNADASNIFKELDILPLNQLITYSIALFMFDYLAGNLPESYTGEWVLNRDRVAIQPRRDLRNNNDFYIPILRYSYLEGHPLFKFPKVWNNLSSDLKSTFPRSRFASALKQSLLDEI